MPRARGALELIGVLTVALFSSDVGGIQIGQPPPFPTPGWDTKANHEHDPNYHKPDYPIAFVKAPVSVSTTPVCRDTNTVTHSVVCSDLPPAQCTDYTANGQFHDREVMPPSGNVFNDHLGADVITATNPGVGNELWIYLPRYAQVKKLFPRQSHFDNGKLDFPPGFGSVVEPSLSEDGRKIYFSYFHDATEAAGTDMDQSERIPLSGADIYAIDIGPLLLDGEFSIDALTVTRLTFPNHRQYVGSTREQDPVERVKDAMNQAKAGEAHPTVGKTRWGTVYLHPTEFRTRTGLHLAYASNKRRLANSNDEMILSNYNLNLHVARLNPDGTLGPDDNQFQYYTTTSAMSPTPLREGLAFSYQATTDDARYWHIQKLDSEGRWKPLIGYGHGDQLFHLGSFCVADENGLGVPGGEKDYFVALKYYNMNNESFGALWKQDLSILGVNTYQNDAGSGARQPRQEGSTLLTPASHSADYPSNWDPFTDNYYGKFTTPRCGRVNELYFAYTQTSANSKLPDRECRKAVYRSHIGYRNNLQPWTPGRPVANGGHQTVIKRTNDDANLLWVVPIVPWSERSNGDVQQQYSNDPATERTVGIEPGEPFAVVGTSALWNTDRRPPECYIPQGGGPNWFHPFGVDEVSGGAGNLNDQITNNQDLWTQVYDPDYSTDPCALPPRSSILGIAINITSNKTALGNAGYVTGFNVTKEATRLLGIYKTEGQQQLHPDDMSFKALIPAHVPFEFQALDSKYGMKLADVRSWHSLKVRETRTDCGGCHQHELNAPSIPFEGTYAEEQPALDLVRSTTSIGYDAECKLATTVVATPTATEGYPEWAEIWADMKQYCNSCHATNDAPGFTHAGIAALQWDMNDSTGISVYNAIQARGFASAQRGALGSQLFWAARGMRTDRRPNDDTQFRADYDCSSCVNGDCEHSLCTDKVQWGFYYSTAHDYDPDDSDRKQCEDADPGGYADWVFKLGKWIDNHMPRNTVAGAYESDWYHPTADVALDRSDCAKTSLRVGYWDDSGGVDALGVRLNDQGPYLNLAPLADRSNGWEIVNNLPPMASTDWITVTVRDAAGNRQIYRKRVDQLEEECAAPPP